MNGSEGQPIPRVVQCCVAKFHHFDLARELHRRGLLASIYTGYPWWKLRGEGLPREKVKTFPWLQTIYMGRSRLRLTHPWLDRELAWWAHEAVDRYCARKVRDCDVLVGLSGSALRAGRAIQARDGRYICDRGSSHIRTQERLLREEFKKWDVPFRGIDPRAIAKEEAEYQQADAITVPSEFALRSFVAEGVPRRKLRRIPYGTELSQFKRCGDPSADTFDLLFIGGVSIRKGVPYLLQAFRDLRHPGKRLRLVGALAPEMESLVNKLGGEGVECCGPLPQRELPPVISTSHVLVLPSIEDGFGLVLAQAMACGCPIVASLHTGGPDLIDHGIEGLLVPPGDTAALTEALQRLIDQPELRQSMAEAALQRVQRLGGWSDYGERFASLCRDVTGGHVAGGRH